MSSDELIACSFCGHATPQGTLATFGARCKPCFEAYCRQRPEAPERPQGRLPAFMPQRKVAVVVDQSLTAENADLARAAPTPSQDRASESHDEPPSWVTEE